MTEPRNPAEPTDPTGAADSGTAAGSAIPADPAQALTGGEMLAVNARTVVGIGTALFGLAVLGLLPLWSWLGSHDHRVWLWTALAGFVLGVAAFPLIGKHTGEGRLG